ncbi:mitochondrial small ribosomal subunit Rsm22-domain-containing protein [Crassisporium funariophilum]|nr:mitochondrial small ribosomal subunit Rsm22-domain-containing protein [Crassisporium funariophilum]
MLHASRLMARRPRSTVGLLYTSFSSSASASHPNPRLNLDPSLQSLLQDVDISLRNAKVEPPPPLRELEVVARTFMAQPHEFSEEEWLPMGQSEDYSSEDTSSGHRKSPAALFGSRQIGAVVLPLELQNAVNLLIADGNKSQIRSDAQRLFKTPEDEGDEASGWEVQLDQKYRNKGQAARHATRDGTAFATVALPAHYSAIIAVLNHLKQRMDPAWAPERIIDWGAGTGSGLWASLYSFQKPSSEAEDVQDYLATNSTISSYVGIEKREGLVVIGKKLVARTSVGGLTVKWNKSMKQEDVIEREDGRGTIALSAFMLTSLSNPIAMKTLVKEMWDSGASTIVKSLVLIDHNSRAGFEAIAHAREYLLKMGKAELEDPDAASWPIRGAHVLAPCPHDRACPLLHSGGAPLVCGFSQRLQRPAFVRLTKHSGVGHEDMEYSYVVIQRGARPDPVRTDIGRIGNVGRRAINAEFAKVPMKELEVQPALSDSGAEDTAGISRPAQPPSTSLSIDETLAPSEVQTQLRLEAYHWPRLVFPPLKKSGHIILDSCTPEGKIMRLTIPKSQGKQPFYDARKSNWGDIFPHIPKNRPLERYQPKGSKSGQGESTGGDIGKRPDGYKNRERASYAAVADTVRDQKKLSKRDYARTRGDKVWQE